MLKGGSVAVAAPIENNVPKPIESQFVARSGVQGYESPYALDPATMQRYSLFKFDYSSYTYVPNPNIPPNSVGILPISGPITKYNGECGEPGAIQRASWLAEMLNRNNITSVVQLLDTPGGESTAQKDHINLIKKSNKPILSYVDGMCASLGVWYSSASHEVYLSDEMDQMGSVGTYCSLLDFRGMLEKEGIKLIEVYAPQSTDKNGDYRQALDGNTKPLEDELKIMVDRFISYVKSSRPDRASINQKAWETGRMFHAQDAVKFGLADGIKSFDQVVSKAAWLAKRKNFNN